jgi:hypothetical protein
MKKSIFGLLFMGFMTACSAPGTRNQMPPLADASAMAKSFPHGSGRWHFSDQRWDNGIHFCEYMSGRDKIITRIENNEACPSEVNAL